MEKNMARIAVAVMLAGAASAALAQGVKRDSAVNGAGKSSVTVTAPSFYATGSVTASDGNAVFGSGTYITSIVFTSSPAIETCAAGSHGLILRQGGGTGSAVRTKLCMCTSDGAASPAYAWMNVTSGTVGTSVSCP